MASFNLTENLLGYKQAKVLTGVEAKYPQRVYVCIPVDVNDIQLKTGSDGQLRATSRLMMEQLQNPDAYLASVNAKRGRSGEDLMTLDQLHSHKLHASFSDEMVQKAVKAYGMALVKKALNGTNNPDKYISQVGAANIDDTKLLEAAQDTSTPIFKIVRSLMQPDLGKAYVMRRKADAQPQAVTVAQGAAGQAYDPTQQAADAFPPVTDQDGNPINEDELPF